MILYDNETGIYSIAPTNTYRPIPQVTLSVEPSESSITVNGMKVYFDSFNINGSNYFKLRDLAYVLSGSEKQFDVTWDRAAKAISLASGNQYTAIGGEMSGKAMDSIYMAESTTSKIFVDGKEVSLTAYKIGGNNYFRLRDIGKIFDFGVDWDGASNTVAIDTGKQYKSE